MSVIDAATMAVTATVDLNASLAASGMVGTVAPRPALALHGGRLYVSAMCTSPRGPVNVVAATATVPAEVRSVKTELHPAVFVIDTATQAELPQQGNLLTARLQAAYDGPDPTAPAVPDDASRRFPLLPSGMAFAPSGGVMYLSAYGADAVFRVRHNPDGSFVEVGTGAARFIDLAPAGAAEPGRLPVGVAVGNTQAGANAALVINENSRTLSALDLAARRVVAGVRAADAPAAGSAEARVNDGRRFFVTGTGRWSLRGQAWNSCESCHVDGLSDNVTWFFARGPRQSSSLDGSYGPDGAQRTFNWTAIFDETQDLELNTRGNSGGVGAFVHTSAAFVRQLVAFLLSIDDTTAPVSPVMGALPFNPDLCPTSFP